MNFILVNGVQKMTLILSKKNKPQKLLTRFYAQNYGRNIRGLITSRHRGGGHKRLYRQINSKRLQYLSIGQVTSIEYDPNRTANIALIHYKTGIKSYILHPIGLNIGDKITTDFYAPIRPGNTLPLSKIPLGTLIHNIEIHPGKGSQIVRSAGAVAIILAKEGQFVTLRLPSGEIKNFYSHCWATIGQVGNLEHSLNRLGKAGRNRWKNRRPHVRGSVMNPVDHPHGGGEGRAPIGKKHPMTPWGKPTLGNKTRISKKYSDKFIIRKRK